MLGIEHTEKVDQRMYCSIYAAISTESSLSSSCLPGKPTPVVQRGFTFWQKVWTRLVAHVRLIVEARRGAEDLAVRVHELVLVSSDVHGVHCALQQVQTLVAGGLQAVLGRQVGPQGAGEAGVVAQVATLGHTRKKKRKAMNFIDPAVGKFTLLQQQKS